MLCSIEWRWKWLEKIVSGTAESIWYYAPSWNFLSARSVFNSGFGHFASLIG